MKYEFNFLARPTCKHDNGFFIGMSSSSPEKDPELHKRPLAYFCSRMCGHWLAHDPDNFTADGWLPDDREKTIPELVSSKRG